MPKSISATSEAAKDTTGLSGEPITQVSSPLYDDRGRTVPWMARTIHRLYDAQAKKILDPENVALPHWYYLRVLAERGELNQLELSKRVGIASTTAVPALDNMEKRDLVQRIRDPKDRRKYYIRLKKEGRRLVDELFPKFTDMISSSIDGISQKEMQTFWKVMHKIEDNLLNMPQDDSIMD